MAGTEHRLERRTRLLTLRVRERVDRLRDELAAPGQRPPFTEAKTAAEALAWWRAHRHDDLGQRVLARYTPDQIADLDVALARDLTAQDEAGQPLGTTFPEEG